MPDLLSQICLIDDASIIWLYSPRLRAIIL